MNEVLRWDIFCAVVDNYGDVGVCWRLARQLAHEFDFAVRLWVDDLASFARLNSDADERLDIQSVAGIEVCRWSADKDAAFSEGVQPADVVIEAFACELPTRYVAAMAARPRKPVWINLEYLSAEDWVEGCHGMASPHPRLPLAKYFFFPGFSEATGGLLRERDLLARRDAFVADAAARAGFWRGAGFAPPVDDALVVSLFAYRNRAVVDLMQAFAQGGKAIVCAVPEGPLLPEIARFFERQELSVGESAERDALHVRVLPFVPQERFDDLLWACDVNFVRGEDSFVRAQWAACPLVWHIYPQRDGTHWSKLAGFMRCYCDGMNDQAARALNNLWEAWNRGEGLAPAWDAFAAAIPEMRRHAVIWAKKLAGQGDLARRLADFALNRLE